MLTVFNTLSRKKEEFKPIGKTVGMYLCGPTVYHFAHIGNLRTYLFGDLLKRILLYNKFSVKHVMNITDVGHLTSDSDMGEDKMLKGAKREGKTVWEIAEFYTDEFKKDLERLNITLPDVLCKATDHIKDMIALIEKLEKKGMTYTAGGNVYFDIKKFKDYGKLALLDIDAEVEARVDVDSNKKHPRDFVLWFTKSKFGDQEMKWDSPWGVGYPGWHIECSAMSMKYLGEHFDIHCGAIDLIPVHHTNEIAQSEGATGKKWVNYWMHGEFIVLNKEKMSKSTGDFLRLKTLLDKGYDPLDYRYFCLGAQYRSKLNFSWEALDGARNSWNNLKEKIKEFRTKNDSKKGDSEKHKSAFLEAVNDDLNMPIALSVVWAVVKDDTIGSKEKLSLLEDFDKVLGLGIADIRAEKQKPLDKEIQALIDKREEARKRKDFKTSDLLRDELLKKGIQLFDTPQGVSWKKV